MYDYINDEQVKCFYTPIFHDIDNDCFSLMNGNLLSFRNNVEVPYKTYYYDYGQNFIILSLDETDCSSLFHVIKNGKVFKTVKNINDINKYINNNEKIIDNFGYILNIKTIEDFNNYKKEKKEFEILREFTFKNINTLYKESLVTFHGLGVLDKNSKIYKEKTKNLENIYTKMDIEKEEIKKEFRNVSSSFYNKWYNNIFKEEQIFGFFINEFAFADKNEYETIKVKFLKFLDENDNILNRYIKWNNINLNELYSILENVL